MTKEKIVRVVPLDPDLKKRHGKSLSLTLPKAKRLQKRGIVRILGDYKEYDENGNKKIFTQTRKKVLRERVQGEQKDSYNIPYLVVPFVPDGQIGKAYNNTMEKFIDDWVIFADHDVLVGGINPLWHEICVKAIRTIGHKAGFISCYTNKIGCRFQKAPILNGYKNLRKSHDIEYHRKYARDLYNKNRGKIKNLTNAKGGRFSGMFILTHKQAWRDAGGFPEKIGFFNVDCTYFTNIKNAGYQVYILEDLYVYHGYFRETLKPFFTKEE